MIQFIPGVFSIVSTLALVVIVVLLGVPLLRQHPEARAARVQLIALAAGVVTTTALALRFSPGHNQVNWNLGLAIAPLCGAFVVIVVATVIPAARVQGVRSAELVPRPTVTDKRGVVSAVGAVAALVLALIGTSLAATPGNPFATDPVFGSEVTIVDLSHSYTAGGGVYPGWYFAVPIFVSVAIVVASAGIAVLRAPSAARSSFVLTVVVLGILGTLASALSVAGDSTRLVSLIIRVPDVGEVFSANQLHESWAQPATAVSWIETVCGAVLFVALAVLGAALVVSLARSLLRPRVTTAKPTPEHIGA